MAFDAVARQHGGVVAALDHARTAALAQQPFDRDGDAQVGIGLQRVQGRKQTGTTGTENQDIGLVAFDRHDAALNRKPTPAIKDAPTAAAA